MILSGISFPNQLIEAIKKNKLVVFAGAGVSKGKPTSFPDFDELVAKLARGTKLVKMDKESDEKFLGRIADIGAPVNEKAAEILSVEREPNAEHFAVINLFIEKSKVKIVTTNYDHMFEKALGEDDIKRIGIYDAPALPLGSDISGIVHIHGNVDCPRYMVLTDSDFGKAYLTEGYASRFLKQLFDTYTVLFLGYSYQDVIVNYLTRAMIDKNRQERYVLTDKPIEEENWKSLGITPIFFPKDKYDVLIEGLKLLGEKAKYDLTEWRTRMEEIKSAPPLDQTTDSEIEYYLRDDEKAQVFANIIDGEKWLVYLESKGVFSNLFDDSGEWKRQEEIWSDWICKKVIGRCDKLFLGVLAAHKGKTAERFAAAMIGVISQKEFPAEYFGKYAFVLASHITDEIQLTRLVNKSIELGNVSSYILLYKKYWDIRFCFKNRIAGEYRLEQVFLGKSRFTTNSWKKGKKYRNIEIAKDFLNFFADLFRKVHDGYCAIGEADRNEEPFWYKGVSIENSNIHTDGMLYCAIGQMEELCEEISKIDPAYVKRVISEGLNTDSVLYKKIMLKLLRTSKLFTADERFELFYKKLDFLYGEEQIVLLVKENYSGLSGHNVDRLVNYIEAIDDDERADIIKYEWCLLIKELTTDNDRINIMAEELLKRNESFKNYNWWKVYDYIGKQQICEENIPPRNPVAIEKLTAKEIVRKVRAIKEEARYGFELENMLVELAELIRNSRVWAVKILDNMMPMGSDNPLLDYYFKGVRMSLYPINEAFELIRKMIKNDFTTEYPVLISDYFLNTICRDDFKENYRNYEIKAFNLIKEMWATYANRGDKSDELDQPVETTVEGKVMQASVQILSYYPEGIITNKYRRFWALTLESDGKGKRAAVYVLAGHFNFICHRDLKWAESNLLSILQGREGEDLYIEAWKGYIQLSRRIALEFGAQMEDIFKCAIPQIMCLDDETRLGVITLFLSLVTYVVDNPIDDFIPSLYTSIGKDEMCFFMEEIGNRLRYLNDSEQTTWWNKWLREFVEIRESNIPVKYSDEERIKMIEWLPRLNSIFPEAVSIICKRKLPALGMTDFWYELCSTDHVKESPAETATLVTKLLEAGRVFAIDEPCIKEIVSSLRSGINKNQNKALDCALLKQNLSV